MYIKTILLLTLLLVLSSEVIAQTVTGTIRDAQTREALIGASVIQKDTDRGTVTDESGRFELALRSGAPAELVVRYIGYRQETISLNRNNLEDLTIQLVPTAILSEDVLVRAHRVDENAPVTYSNISRDDIEKQDFGKDITYALQSTPSVVTTSDAGHGLGYTGIRIRGVDPQRINVTINGIPLNDAESHGVWWVNMPDFISSTDNIQIQRGVGTSTHGPAAFGASINLQTTTLNQDPYGRFQSGFGSYNTFRNTVQVGTGLLNNGWSFDGRLSKITSDGYVDRAFSDLQSFYVSATRHGERSMLKANVFSGQEQTYQAWYGIPEASLDTNRTWNHYTYDNETDNYQQDHYQLHHSYQLADSWLINTSLHYTYGRGYYEQFGNNDSLSSYGFAPIEIGGEVIERSDMIRRRWLDNDFYGVVFSTNYTAPSDRWGLIVGGGYNIYDGDHFGEVIWARFAGDQNIRERYYDNVGLKKDFNIYAKADFALTDRISVFGDVQLRTIDYSIDGIDNNLLDISQEHDMTFFNPKAGLVYRLDDSRRLYASYSIGNKEPTRRDFTDAFQGDADPRSERLKDLEVGYRGDFNRYRLGVNLYYMDYDDQLILIGDINDVGAPIRTNVEDSYRAGIELEAGIALTDWLQWNANATFSRNKVAEFTETLVNYDTGGLETITHTDSDIAFSPSVISGSMIRATYEGFIADFNTRYVSRQYLDNTQTESRNLDPYLVNDLSLQYNITNVRYINNLRVGVSIHNLFNELYESNGYTYGYIAGGETIYENWYYPQAGRHFMAQVVIDF